MPFRLRRETRSWFRDIADTFALDFDMYYICLITGLVTGRKSEISNEETTVLVDNFPGGYRETGGLIVGLFLTTELQELGVSRSERVLLNEQISTLIDPMAPSHLSEVGLREINRYSYGGFDQLTEWFDDRPRTFETFFPLFKRRLDERLLNVLPTPF